MLITHEDLLDLASTPDDTMQRSKSRLDMKGEASITIDDKRTKARTAEKSRTIKSAPAVRRSKSQTIVTTRSKELNTNSSQSLSSVISICCVHIYMHPLSFRFVLLLFRYCPSLKRSLHLVVLTRVTKFLSSSEAEYSPNSKTTYDDRFERSF
jgi:hypothetical protein